MRYYLSQAVRIAILATCCFGVTLSARCVAQDGVSLILNQPAPPAEEQLVLPSPQVQPDDESIPAPFTSESAARPAPPIKYHTSRSARRMLRREATFELLMVARNPADGCLYEIPLCLPACCVGEPVVEERRGLGGRGVVEYCWECGFTATVKFRHRMGDVKIEYDT